MQPAEMKHFRRKIYMQPAYCLQKCDFEKLISVTFFMKMIFKEELDLPSSCHYHVIILITKNVDNTREKIQGQGRKFDATEKEEWSNKRESIMS
jgi:hypothetical protein